MVVRKLDGIGEPKQEESIHMVLIMIFLMISGKCLNFMVEKIQELI